jgi:hypothetical protein
VESSLFKIPPEIKGLVVSSAKTICYMVKESEIESEYILVEFTNYVLGTLFKLNPELYFTLKADLSKRLPEREDDYMKRIKPEIEGKYFSNHGKEYDFLTTELLRDKVS